jgi:DNA-binding MurR/RpiR family transcriptional regulator
MKKNKPPTTPDELRDWFGRESERLTPRMRDAARYALDHPKDIALSPVAAVAERSGIAAAAFIRMAQAVGYQGYGDLQRVFREPLQRAAPTYRERIRHFGGEQALDDPQDPQAVLQAFSQANIVSLEHLRDDARSLPLKQAIALIQQARVVYVLGLRRSYAVAAYLAYALARVGQPAVQITGVGGAIAEQAGAIGPQDLLIAISFPPYAGDTLQVCDLAQAAGAKRLAMTNSVMSPVARGADLLLEVNDAELLGFRSLTASLSLAQTLAMGLAFARRRQGLRTGQAPTLDDIDC